MLSRGNYRSEYYTVSRHTRKCHLIYFPKAAWITLPRFIQKLQVFYSYFQIYTEFQPQWIINVRSIHRNSFADASAVWLTVRRHSRNSQSVNKALWVCSGPTVTGLKEKHRKKWKSSIDVVQ